MEKEDKTYRDIESQTEIETEIIDEEERRAMRTERLTDRAI